MKVLTENVKQNKFKISKLKNMKANQHKNSMSAQEMNSWEIKKKKKGNHYELIPSYQ